MAKRLLAPIINSIKRLRELEKVAERYPGFEEDHDYDLSADYMYYYNKMRRLGQAIGELPQPEGWLEMSKWCDENPHHFGAPTYANVHRCNLDWEEDVSSIRTLILESIHRRLRERRVRPEDERIWSDRRVIDLLKDTDWMDHKTQAAGGLIHDNPRVELKLVEIAHLLGKEGKAFRDSLQDGLRKAVEVLDEVGAWFEPKEMTTGTDKETVYYRSEFTMGDIPKGEHVGLMVNRRDRDARNQIEQFAAKISRGRKARKVTAQGTIEGTTVELGDGWIKVKCNTKKAKKEWDIRKGTPLELVVRIEIPSGMRKELDQKYFEWYRPSVDYVGALSNAPEPPLLVGDGTYRCQTCGDDTIVRIDGKCPACHEGIPTERPLKDDALQRMKAAVDRWQHLECQTYGCYGRDFKTRYRRTLDHDLMCLKCKTGWLVEDAEVIGPDPRSRTSSIMPPGFGWKWRWGQLADAIDSDRLPEDECIEFIYKEVGGYRHTLWGGEPWIMYLTQVAAEFERYLDELEARKGKEEQAWSDRNGLKSRDTIVLLRKLIEKSKK